MAALKTNTWTAGKKVEKREICLSEELILSGPGECFILGHGSRRASRRVLLTGEQRHPCKTFFLTQPGKITHSCVPFLFFTDDTILSSHSSLTAPHGHVSDVKLWRCSMPPFYCVRRKYRVTIFQSGETRRRT